jgi:hypothetical protein
MEASESQVLETTESTEIPEEVPEVQEVPEPDIDSLKKDARESAIENVITLKDTESKSARGALYSDACGTLGEQIAMRANGLASLDDSVKHNFETFDLCGEKELASVKSHIVGNEDNAIGEYAQDLRTAMGLRETGKFDTAATRLLDSRNEPDQWEYLKQNLPEAVRNASSLEEIQEAMNKTATLRVPADHVKKVHDYLDEVVPANPELYGIDVPKDDPGFKARLQELKDRVRPIAEGVTAHDMRVEARSVFRGKLGLDQM